MIRTQLLVAFTLAFVVPSTINASSVIATRDDQRDERVTPVIRMSPMYREPSDCALTYRGNPFQPLESNRILKWTASPEKPAKSSLFLENMWNAALDNGVCVYNTGNRCVGFFKLSPKFYECEGGATIDFKVSRYFDTPKLDKFFMHWMIHLGNYAHGKKFYLPGDSMPYTSPLYTMGRFYVKITNMRALLRESDLPLRPDHIITSMSRNGLWESVVECLLPIAGEPTRTPVRIEEDYPSVVEFMRQLNNSTETL